VKKNSLYTLLVFLPRGFVVKNLARRWCAPLVRGGFCFLATQQKFYAIRTTYFLTVPKRIEKMNFDQAIDYIHSTWRFGSKLGLDNMRRLMERLGRPEKRLKFAHVAGTNGKGSVSAFLSSALTEAGYGAGLYISPYIHRFNERISVDGAPISDGDIAELTTDVAAVVADITREGFNHPTEFEIITSMAFLYFAKKRCDIVVLEVGLGGRLDATNIIERPVVSIITPVDFDHEAYLGKTLTEIAREKAGIIKNGGTVVTCRQQEEAAAEITQTCRRRNARLLFADGVAPGRFSRLGQTFSCGGLKDAEIALLGTHQPENAALALKAIDVLREEGFDISEDALREGLKKTRWPGRFEWIAQNPDVVIDGAHNSHGARMLAANLQTYFPNKEITFIAGILEDKDYDSMIKAVAPLAKAFFAVTPPTGRGLPADALARRVGDLDVLKKPAIAFQSVTEALDAAIAAEDGGVICVFGSLYLVGEARTWAKGQRQGQNLGKLF
jgi:dihydrofolate synthase/folylpolyglutamate synthase